MISAVILAAGLSRRMGKPKLILRRRGKTLVRTVAENVLTGGAEEVILVTGAYGRAIAGQVNDLPLTLVHNPDYASGQGTSLAVGASSVNPQSDAVMVLMGDQPLITPHLIRQFTGVFLSFRPLIMRPAYNGRPGHPVFFNSVLLPELVKLSGDTGARGVLEKYRGELYLYPTSDPAVCFDVDTPEDYKKWLTGT